MEQQLLLEIKNAINKYHNATSSDKKNSCYIDVLRLIELYSDLTFKKYFFFVDFKHYSKYKEDVRKENRMIYLQISKPEYCEMVNDFTKNGIAILNDKLDFEISNIDKKISFSKACDIIYNFFNEYDKKLVPFVKNILENNLVFCLPDDENLAYTNNIVGLNKSYITLFSHKNEIDIKILISLVHELGHVIHHKLNEDNITGYSNFVEVFPHFLEQIFIQYCVKNNIYSKECLQMQKNNLINLHRYLNNLATINYFIEEVGSNSLSLYLRKKDLKGLTFENEKLIYKNCEQQYLYSYGLSLSYYYSNLYKIDPEKIKIYLNGLIKECVFYKDLFILNHYGIEYDVFIKCDYLNPVIDKNKELLKRSQF